MPTFCFASRSSSIVSLRSLFIAAVTVILLASLHSAEVHAQDGDQPSAPPASDGEPRTPHSAQEYYGLNFVAPFQPWLRYGLETGAGTVRWQFNWRDYETSPGTWVWQVADGYIRNWNNAGYRIHAILHNPPDFAKVRSDGLMPTNVRLPWNDPANGFAQYCYKFAQRYQGLIDSYEIWNEPDINTYWDGTAEEYFYLMKGCYLAIKAADPDVTVAMAGMVVLAERNFLPEVLRLAASDPEGPANNYFFDVANIHMYADPSLVYSLTQHVRRLLNTYGQGNKPIWVTETNVALAGYGSFPNRDWGHVTAEEQAWYITQATASAYAAGADRLMFFRLADDNMDEYFGLMSNNYTLRPSYRTLQIVTSLVHDVIAARREIRQGVIITYLVRSDGARIVILYSETGTGLNLQLEAHQTAAVVINASGGATTIRANNGLYTVSLPTARGRDFSHAEQYAVGGPPLIVVEQDTQPPVSWLELQPVPGSNGQVTIKLHSDDGEFGTGVESYEIQVSINDGEWQPLAAGVIDTELSYDISEGGRFAFRVRSVDRAGNIGEFSQPVSTSLTRTGTLLIEVRDLRGQPVPYARVTLSDGTLYDADEHGIVTIVAEPGLIRVTSIDGSGQGRLAPSQPYEIELLEQSLASWTLMPLQDLIVNGQFEFGLQGWAWSAPADVITSRFDAQRGAVLRLQGVMRPWGPPAAAATVDVPMGWIGGLLSFYYRLENVPASAGSSQSPPYLRLRVFTETEQDILWYATEPSTDFQRVAVDMSAYEGQQVTLVFELVGPKLGPEGVAEIDEVIFGNVPVLP